jgi:cell division protein FtsI/penicillin-binding protein 2
MGRPLVSPMYVPKAAFLKHSSSEHTPKRIFVGVIASFLGRMLRVWWSQQRQRHVSETQTNNKTTMSRPRAHSRGDDTRIIKGGMMIANRYEALGAAAAGPRIENHKQHEG